MKIVYAITKAVAASVALGDSLLAAATETEATKQQRDAVLGQLRRLTNQMPDSAELRQVLAEAVHKLH